MNSKQHLAAAGPGIAERWFGINKLKPPPLTDDVKKNQEFPLQIQLGEYKLQMDSNTGKWILVSANAPPIQINSPTNTTASPQSPVNSTNPQQAAQIQQLQSQLSQSQLQINELQKKLTAAETAAKSSTGSNTVTANQVYDAEKRAIEIEKVNITLCHEINQLRFKNKVLMAMCAISEGDYKALCKEAGIEPKDRPKKPDSNPPAIQSQPPQQQLQQQQAITQQPTIIATTH